MPDFSESNLEQFDICLSMLVKIEDKKSELIQTFLDRFKYLINKKFDEIFGMREGVTEIDFFTYSKIYDNYEFAINENEFLFYENQIENEVEKNQNINLDIRNLSSKYFKKGTFIWMCKKIQESVVSQFLLFSYKYFINLFEKKNADALNFLFNHVIETFNKKINDVVEKSKRNFQSLDPIFFREGLISFYIPYCEILQSISNDKLNASELSENILHNNINLVEKYIANIEFLYIIKISEIINSSVLNMKERNLNRTHGISFDGSAVECSSVFNKISKVLLNNLDLLKKMDLGEIYNTVPEETNKIYFKYLCSFISLFYYVLKSTNTLQFNIIKLKEISLEDMPEIRITIKENFKVVSKERIFTKILLCKVLTTNNGTKIFLDKILKEFTMIKNNKSMLNEMKCLVDKETTECLNLLYDSLVQFVDMEIFSKLRNLFYNINWLNYDKAVTFRLELRNICYQLYNLKNELYELLNDERKNFEEVNASVLNEAVMWKNTQRRMSKYQKEMECIHIRRLTIYKPTSNSPQEIMLTVARIFLKEINEFIKIKKFSKEGFQQVQIDMNLIKYFFRENLIVDVEKILDGFFLEIMKNCSSNCINAELFDETVIFNIYILNF